jgi:hypothetical protein
MKKNIITAGVLAAGVAGLYAENVTGLTDVQKSKPWNVSGTIRGFYDSNPEAQHSNPQGSWGISLSPSIGVNLPMENSLLTANLIYTAWWYEARDDNNWDQQFEANVNFNHKFSEHSVLNVGDSFIYTDQPAVTDVGSATQPLQRSDNSYLRNRFPIDFMTKFTERFGIDVGFQNTYYNYQDDIYAAQLNRVENLAHVDLDYYLQEQLVLLAGYQFGWTDYLSNDIIVAADPATGTPAVHGDDRSNTSHYFYGGVQTAFTSQLKAALKLGAVYTDWSDLNQSDWTPYVDGNVTYNYLPGSYVQGGLTVTHNATDVVAPSSSGQVTLDQSSVIPYIAVTHSITPRLMLNLLGQIQFSTYQDGAFDGDTDVFWTIGISLRYLFSKNFFMETGYNYQDLGSDVPGRSFNRNRVFLGAGVTY